MRVLIADDQKPFGGYVREILGKSQQFQIVGEAVDGLEAVKLVGELQPELVLMDVEMPLMNGFKAAAQILERYAQTKILLLSMYHDNEYSRLAKAIGALGCLPKRDLNLSTLLHLLGQE